LTVRYGNPKIPADAITEWLSVGSQPNSRNARIEIYTILGESFIYCIDNINFNEVYQYIDIAGFNFFCTGQLKFETPVSNFSLDGAGDFIFNGGYIKAKYADTAGNQGRTGTISLAKLTTLGIDGSITIQDGIITGFVNPT
jgi:hypothetical protein